MSMEPYPQSPEMEQFFTMLRIATLPTRLHVHPSPEIEAWDTESRDDPRNRADHSAIRLCACTSDPYGAVFLDLAVSHIV